MFKYKLNVRQTNTHRLDCAPKRVKRAVCAPCHRNALWHGTQVYNGGHLIKNGYNGVVALKPVVEYCRRCRCRNKSCRVHHRNGRKSEFP